MSGLSTEVQLFADSYIADPYHDRLRAAQAAWPSLSDPEARKLANAALRRHDVAAYIRECMGEILERVESSPEKLYAELAKIAYANIQECMGVDGAVLPIHHLPAHVAAAICEAEITEVGGVRRARIKLSGKLEAIKLLLQSQGLLKDKREITGPGNGPVRIESTMSAEEATRIYMQTIAGGDV